MKNPLSSQARSEPFSAIPRLTIGGPRPSVRAAGKQFQASAAAAPVRPAGELVRSDGEQAPHIQFPLNGARIEVTGAGAMPVKVAGGVLPMTMLVNGVSVGEIDGLRQRLVDPPGPGFARLTVMDVTGAADTVLIRIQ